MLQTHAGKLILANAHHVRALPGEKTDNKDGKRLDYTGLSGELAIRHAQRDFASITDAYLDAEWTRRDEAEVILEWQVRSAILAIDQTSVQRFAAVASMGAQLLKRIPEFSTAYPTLAVPSDEHTWLNTIENPMKPLCSSQAFSSHNSASSFCCIPR